MERVIAILIVVALLAVWWRSAHGRSSDHTRSPIWLAFNTTAAALLFLVAGGMGYHLDRRARFFTGAAWSETVIWWELGVGLALVPVALFCWRRAFREVDRRVGRA